ncbi:phosphatase PAP2 family protein [Pontibacter pamirensis]|uniref:phosphatase PAP2 family protein n=1 Tax=Pontibacter pamirensis TaxID=2562824 RepID=UPI00138A3221|nr:phosphatase PAP2 family protein [Pontibacter pamirensis]
MQSKSHIQRFLTGSIGKGVAVLLLAQSFSSFGQTPPTAADTLSLYQSLQTEVSQGPGQHGDKEKPRASESVLSITGASALWAATFVFADEPLQQLSQNIRNGASDGFTDILEPLGRQKHWVPVAGAALVGGIALKDPMLRKAGIVSIGSIIVNGTLTDILKRSIGRYRPSTTTDNEMFDTPFSNSPHTSLPSSHTSTAFAVATSVATVYSKHRLVPPLAYGMATLVGLSRIHDNQHWATDVIAGAVVGYLSSKVVIYVYEVVNQKLKNRKQYFTIVPRMGPETAGVNASWVF